MNQLRLGYLYGLGAYVLWGFFPAYFKLLRPSGPMEILAHRILWSCLFMVILLTLIRRWSHIRSLLRRPAAVADRQVSIGDIHATIYKAMGIDWNKEIMHPVGRPLFIANDLNDQAARPIHELVG